MITHYCTVCNSGVWITYNGTIARYVVYYLASMSHENTARNKDILALNKNGMGARKIAKVYNITPQRVTKIIAQERAKMAHGE